MEHKMVGKRFGRWLVTAEGERKGWNRMFLCQCDCGAESLVYRCHLLCGASKSCGCYAAEVNRDARLTHGLLWAIWWQGDLCM